MLKSSCSRLSNLLCHCNKYSLYSKSRVVKRFSIATTSAGKDAPHEAITGGGDLVPSAEFEDNKQDTRGKFSHPYKNLFPWKSRIEFGDHLVQNIVHNDDGLIVINKPFGVGVIRPVKKPKGMQFQSTHLRGTGVTDYSLEDALPYLRKALDKPELALVKSTERMSSGIAVFANNLKEAEKFRKHLKLSKASSNSSPLYNYLVVTALSPATNETVFHERVGMQLKHTVLADYMQPTITRKFSNNAIKRQEVIPVHVHMEVQKYGIHKTALLQIQTTTVRWNFLRIYCADLLIPMLGDHLYSCRVQTIMGVPTTIDMAHATPGSADQKLSPKILDALMVRESIEIPPHMHLQSYMLYNYRGKKEHLELTAPPPSHFEWTQEQLKLL